MRPIYLNKINKGFSLIELVIVIAVFAILSTVAIPAFLVIREKAADRLVKVSMINSLKECQIGKSLEEEIIHFCRNNLSSIKCPKTVDFEKELPRHPTGKLYKRLLKDRYWGKKDSKIV